MAITLSSATLTRDQNQVGNLRAKHLEECKYLLRRLKGGTYTISWDGMLPVYISQRKNHKEKQLEIGVETTIEYGKFIHLRKPYVTKQIKVGGKDISFLRTWTSEQLVALIDELKQILDQD